MKCGPKITSACCRYTIMFCYTPMKVLGMKEFYF